MDNIIYKGDFPYYKGMPCFLDGKRLNSIPYIDKDGFLSAYYWRDGGLWGIRITEIYPNVFVYNDDSLEHLYLSQIEPMTFEEWKNDNGVYAPRCSNVIEALESTGLGGHKGIILE